MVIGRYGQYLEYETVQSVKAGCVSWAIPIVNTTGGVHRIQASEQLQELYDSVGLASSGCPWTIPGVVLGAVNGLPCSSIF